MEPHRLLQRLSMLMQLIPLLFCYAYTPALIIRIIVYSLRPDLFPHYGLGVFTPFSTDAGWFLLDGTWAVAVSCIGAACFGGLFSVRFGIAAALALSLANGIIVNTTDDTFVGIVFGLAFGVLLGITFNSANEIKQAKLENFTISSTSGVCAGLAVGLFTGTLGGYWAGFAMGTLDPVLVHTVNIVGSSAGLFVGGIAGGCLAALLGFLISRNHKGKINATTLGIKIAIAVATAFGGAIGIPVGDVGVNHAGFLQGLSAGISEEVVVGIAFLLCYLLCYYRLPLYPISAYSSIQAYIATQNKFQQALYCLRNSALHWDECVFLPLPYLQRLLLLAAEQSLDGTLKEIDFIVRERPQQRWAAQATAYALALRDLQQRTVLHDIGLAHQQLTHLLPPQVRMLSANAEIAFRHIEDASREAASYQSQMDKHDRQEALGRMLAALQNIQSESALRNTTLSQHLTAVVSQWRMLAMQAGETLKSTSGKLFIDNPYAPGNPLEPRDPLFVGREDSVQKLGQALQKRYRPTFLLTGERRMGKSSIIKQLPILLGTRYIPVFYDLQSIGMLASIAAFLATVSRGITRQLKERGIFVRELERAQLEEAQQQSEMATYDRFERWLNDIEQILNHEDRTLILAFDEFEKLEEASNSGNLKLELLFDLFRNIIQNRSRLALLFSGAKMIGDMGRSWAGYFVNVERIKVSFLREREAYDLITRPVPHIFTAEVAQHIIDMTHGHPFLVQAVCKSTIEQLNDSEQKQATPLDVAASIKAVFESWSGYFWDQWDRNDADQAACLRALCQLKQGSLAQIIQACNLTNHRGLIALEKLSMRDIVTHEQTFYHFTVPIFAQWVEQHYALLAATDFAENV